MPFAGFKDHADCVAHAPKDVKDKDAYCAQIHHTATGKWPSEKSLRKSMTIDNTMVVGDYGDDSNFVGWVENKQHTWIVFIDKAGSPLIWLKRDVNGGVIGEPITMSVKSISESGRVIKEMVDDLQIEKPTWCEECQSMVYSEGGEGSGHHGHAGVPGQRGGSAPGSGSSIQDKADAHYNTLISQGVRPDSAYNQTKTSFPAWQRIPGTGSMQYAHPKEEYTLDPSEQNPGVPTGPVQPGQDITGKEETWQHGGGHTARVPHPKGQGRSTGRATGHYRGPHSIVRSVSETIEYLKYNLDQSEKEPGIPTKPVALGEDITGKPLKEITTKLGQLLNV